MLQAALALASRDGRRAVTILEASRPFERATGPRLAYLRGLAYELLQDHRNAAAQFRDVVSHTGNQPTNLLHAIARLPLAHALAGAGDVTEARQMYADFAAAWRNADPRQRLLVNAIREAAALPPAASPVRNNP
jgi:hypothetical protein